jgi:hypothetical protein
MHIRLVDENDEWVVECPIGDVTERESILLAMLGDCNCYIVERFRSRIAARLPRIMLDNLEGAACDPSAEQIELAQQISEYLNVPIPKEALCFRDLMSDFIAEYLHSFYLTRAIEAKVIDL